MNGRTNALVLSGGGSKGAFSVGAIEYMIDKLGLRFDIVSGTSTGALISPLVAAGKDEWRVLKEVYTSVKTGDVIVRRPAHSIINSVSVYKVDPLTKLIKHYLTPQRVEMILQSQTMMFITAVCLQTGRLFYFQTGPRDGVTDELSTIERIQDFDGLARAVLASADQPVLTPPVKIPKSGPQVRQFVDGGVKEYAPFKIAIDNGATDIYAVLLSPAPKDRRKETEEYKRVVPILIRTIDMLVDDVGENDLKVAQIFNNALDYIDGARERVRARFNLSDLEIEDLFAPPEFPNPFAGRRKINVHVIRPKKSLGAGLEFNPAKMKAWMKLGFEQARQVLA